MARCFAYSQITARGDNDDHPESTIPGGEMALLRSWYLDLVQDAFGMIEGILTRGDQIV